MALWGNIDQAADKPKYLTTAEKNATAGVSEAEAALAANKAKGLQHAGWVQYSTYTDGQGNTRHKSETLVAMSSITSDNNADDTTVGIDPVITIGTQPTNASVTSPASATFTVAATVNNGATPAYQWQFNTGTSGSPIWTNIAGKTAATLTVASTDAQYVTTSEFRVVVSSTGAANVNSSTVVLTIA
jgi:hypothetical protein